jgi:hypothetical protein
LTQYTLDDLALRTLRDLNIVDSEATPSAADLEFVKETIEVEFARMNADGIIMWGTTVDSIPDVYFRVLSQRMGFAVGPQFGIMDAKTAAAGIDISESLIRRLSAPTKYPEELQIERSARGTRIRDPIISQ